MQQIAVSEHLNFAYRVKATLLASYWGLGPCNLLQHFSISKKSISEIG